MFEIKVVDQSDKTHTLFVVIRENVDILTVFKTVIMLIDDEDNIIQWQEIPQHDEVPKDEDILKAVKLALKRFNGELNRLYGGDLKYEQSLRTQSVLEGIIKFDNNRFVV